MLSCVLVSQCYVVLISACCATFSYVVKRSGMLCYAVLCCAMCYVALCYSMWFSVALCSAMLYYIAVWFYVVICCVMLRFSRCAKFHNVVMRCARLSSAALCRLHCVVLCCSLSGPMLRYGVLCCTMLCYVAPYCSM